MRVLLVGPRFHGYSEAMAEALRALGHEVTVHEYDATGSTLDAVRNKVAHDLPGGRGLQWQQRWYDDRAIAALHTVRPDALLVVKGDVFSERWWDTVHAWGGPSVVWFYDERERMSFPEQTLAGLPAVATYSSADSERLRARGVNAHHLPLAFDSLIRWRRRPVDAVTFIGARYPQREAMLRTLAGAGVPVKAFGRDWSRHPSDVLRSRHWRGAGVPAGRNLARDEAYGVMAGSEATLNIHGRQDGFTMRTFEACGVGAVQLVDRPEVEHYFAPGEEVLVFQDQAELDDLAARVVADPVWARTVAARGQRRALAEHTFVHRMQTLQGWWA
ncbi:CgeB family protein [Micrococcus lylae]|uniref:CgeB family protein n=1 Tax=Micrococcus lylae TaxID=1273 RepID=UPI003EBC8893